MADTGWNFHRAEIERLYIQENQTRDEVMKYMATNHSWKKSGAQYSRKFKEWGLRKHSNPREDQWISRRIEKRKRENKESEVFVNGIQIHPAKIIRSSYRKGYLTEYSRRGPSPSTPEGYVVTTPPVSCSQTSWTDSFPWMRFMSLFQPPQNDDVLHSPSTSFALSPLHNEIAVSKGLNFELMKILGSIIPWNKLQTPQNVPSASRTSAALSILMPEKKPGQHDTLAMDLSTSSAGIRESMGLLFYMISNNLTSGDSEDFFVTMERDDKLVLQGLKDIGWDDLRHLKFLVTSREPTAESIAERLFAAAVREKNFFILQKMLQCGMDPNGLVEDLIGDFGGPFFTPLQHLIASNEDVRFMNLLISYGADVDFSINENGENALYYAIRAKNKTVIRLLLDHGATVTRKCAGIAVAYRPDSIEHFSLLEYIINSYFDQDVARLRDDTGTLQMAIMQKNPTMVQLFAEKGANINGLIEHYPDSERHQTTLLGLAVHEGRMDLVRPLLHVSAREDLPRVRPRYVSPLDLAAGCGFIEICKLLLSSGADNRAADEGRKTLLERAVPNKNLALCQLLIENGAKIDRDPRNVQQRPSALMIAVQKGLMDIVELLIGSNARLNDVFEKGPETILAAAIEAGDVAMINKLENAGARNIGAKLDKIGNLQTAVFFLNRGLLPMLLNSSGPKLLETAISAQDNDLAWFLLQNNAHMEQNGMMPLEKTPLWAALQSDNLSLVLALLECGAHVTDDALTEVINKGKTDLLPILLAGFTGNAPTAVFAAVLKSSMMTLQLLREAIVDFRGVPQMSHHRWDIANQWHLELCSLQSILELAAWKADYLMFKYILEWAISAQINWSRESVARALTLAIFERKHDHISYLMRLDSDLNCSITSDASLPFHGLTFGEHLTYNPLQAAVKTQLVSVVRDLLVMKRADVNHLGHGKMRRTPLQHAVELGDIEIFNLLLEHGADVNAPAADDGGATALQIAAIKGYIGIVRTLLDLGADVNQEPALENGRTALMGAAEHGRIDVLQMLLKEKPLAVGEDDENDDYYYDAVELAEGRGHYAAARLLKSFKNPAEFASCV